VAPDFARRDQGIDPRIGIILRLGIRPSATPAFAAGGLKGRTVAWAKMTSFFADGNLIPELNDPRATGGTAQDGRRVKGNGPGSGIQVTTVDILRTCAGR
jgi:hypothetical protein